LSTKVFRRIFLAVVVFSTVTATFLFSETKKVKAVTVVKTEYVNSHTLQ